MKRFAAWVLVPVLILSTLVGCQTGEEPFVGQVTLTEITEEDRRILGELPDGMTMPQMPEAPGEKTKQSYKAIVDYSNAEDGYVMVKFLLESTTRLKCQLKGPDDVTYTYNLNPQEWTVFPFSAGNGEYKITVYQENRPQSGKYATVLSITTEVTLTDEFAPFLLPNQYVNYENEPKTIAKAEELVGDKEPLDAVAAVYDYVVTNLTYDKQKAKTVESGYLPDLDTILEANTGICFDYAALMAAMLRSQGIPCKLVVGYAGTAYHAWISVWTEETGWVDDAIFFDGDTWQRMDPTFASSGKQSAAIMKYIGDGSHYKECYIY